MSKSKEKAEELVDNFRFASSAYTTYSYLEHEIPETIHLRLKDMHAKECALKCVDEILDSSMGYFDDNSDYVNYWQQVKKEIEKL